MKLNSKIEEQIPLNEINTTQNNHGSKDEDDEESVNRTIYAPDYNVSKMPEKSSRKINIRDNQTGKYNLKTITVLKTDDITFRREAHKNVRFSCMNIFSFIVFLIAIFIWTFGYSETLHDYPNPYVDRILELTAFYVFGMVVIIMIYLLVYYRLYQEQVDKSYILSDETEALTAEYSKET